MKRALAVLLLRFSILVLAVSMSGCKSNTDGSAASDENTPSIASPREHIDAATTGSLAGVVKFEGTPHKPRVINMAAVPNCAKMHSSPAMTEEVALGENGTLQNAVVYLKGDFSRYAFDSPPSPAMMDQKGCTYGPHVIALMTGQQLQITNSDQAAHNINAAPKLNRRWNESQPAGASPITEVFVHPEIGIPIRCNVHPWMKAYISVFSSPYFEVTRQNGTFEIENVPPGTYILTAWHELYGTREKTVTVREHQHEVVDFTFTDRDH